MTITTYGNTAATVTSLQGRIMARIASTRANWGKWRVYRRTVDELSMLSDRDLADLGLNRSMIERIAIEAAYGR